MPTTSYSQINTLEEDVFIAGTTRVYTFTVYDEYGVAVDLAGATVYWVLCYYGQPETPLLRKYGTITGTNTFTISLVYNDTYSLYGKFLHQPVIVDGTGDEFRPAQGIITIIAKLVES